MNLIVIVMDSFRQDHVGFYSGGAPVYDGIAACQTPHLDAFARESIVFTGAYPEALPTIPARVQLFTGHRRMPFQGWGPMPPGSIPLAEYLRAAGYVSAIISDNYHFCAPGMDFHRGFHARRWVRGQERDPYTSHPPRRRIDDYANERYNDEWRFWLYQYLANTDHFQTEADYFAAQVANQAIEWLRHNRVHERVFAWIDFFDPHEPWDPPPRWDTYTDPNWTGKQLILPTKLPLEQWITPKEVQFMRGKYAGEAAFVDHSVGRILAALRALGYYEDSAILIMADHGQPLADHNKLRKTPEQLYNGMLRVPFMLRLPGAAPRRTDALIQWMDVLPTLLDVLGLGSQNDAAHGRSFLPVLRGDADSHRDAVISGWHEHPYRCIRDGAWSLLQGPEGRGELYRYQEDPFEQRSLIDEYPAEAARLAARFGSVYRRATDDSWVWRQF